MAQHDYNIANQSFPSFRTDLNNVLSAINTSNSGTSRPSSAVNGTIWLDTTNATTPTLKLYDGADDISLATFDYSANTVNWLDSTVSADLVNDLSPQLGGMLDVNGNAIGNGTEELIKFSETTSAVNEITVTNSATGNAPEISATGSDTNIDFKLTPKGTGKLILDGLNFPTSDGTTGQFLKTDGSGNLSFDDAGGGKVLQVVNGNFGTEQNISSSSYVASAMTLNITPSSTSSKVLVISAPNSDGYINESDHRQFYLRLVRGTTNLMIKQIQIGGVKNPTNNYVYGSIDGTMCYLDSPSSTSTLTYTIQAKVSDSVNNCNVRFNGTSSAGHSTLTLMEISA